MSAKEALIWDVNGGVSVAEAAERHGVARSCAYKWVGRYAEFGVEGLHERSRRPEHSPRRTPQAIVDELLELKRKYEDFGPAKLAAMLEARHGERVMAASTAGVILDRHGKVQKRRRGRPSPGQVEHSPYEVAGAGDSMTTDYKGQFRMEDGRWCYPLTIADPFSRYVLAIVAFASTHLAQAKRAFERVFREFGIPRQMINDNGTPFCSSVALGGLTQLTRWWIELGITPIRILPARPDQNAIHERMHRTFKAWIKRHPRKTLAAHQRSFDAFRREFNDIRPHQSLGQKPPATAFKSYRPYSSPRPIEYDSTMTVRKVNANGEIKWGGRPVFLTEVLIGGNVGLLPIGEQLWSIHYSSVRIGYLDTSIWRALNRLPPPTQE